MTQTLTKPAENKTGFTDVLLIGTDTVIRRDMQKVFDNENFSWQNIDLDAFLISELNTNQIGTAVIDMDSIADHDQETLLKIVESLDRVNIPTVICGKTDSININNLKYFNVIEKASPRQIIPVIKTSNVYRKRVIESKKHNANEVVEKDSYAQQLEYQLKMAGAVQKDFLPRTLPDNEKFTWSVTFIPAEWVSGDIYDVARLDEQHIGFYLADAVGHSIPAALLTMFLKQAVQMRQTIGSEYKIFQPLDVINSLNEKMVNQHLSGCQFATCCYCLLNTQTLKLYYCRAGHPYPVLIRKDQPPQQLQTRGSLLGVFDNAAFEQADVQLAPGDKLLLYSDGAEPFIATPENNSTLEFNKWFLEVAKLSAADLTSQFESLIRQSKNIAEPDDISLLALEIM